MSVRLIGANPGLTLFDEGRVVAFSSLWRVDWSERGAGDALVLWHDGRVRIVAPDVELGRWLADTFVRHFPEVVGLPWPEPNVTTAPVLLELDPATGVRAEAADVVLTITAPLDRRLMTADPVDLGGRPHGFLDRLHPLRRRHPRDRRPAGRRRARDHHRRTARLVGVPGRRRGVVHGLISPRAGPRVVVRGFPRSGRGAR